MSQISMYSEPADGIGKISQHAHSANDLASAIVTSAVAQVENLRSFFADNGTEALSQNTERLHQELHDEAEPSSPKTSLSSQNRWLTLESLNHDLVKLNRADRRHAASVGIDLDGDGFLRLNEVLAVYPVSRAAWYAGIKVDIYPKPVQLGKRSVGWSRKSIRDLVAKPPEF